MATPRRFVRAAVEKSIAVLVVGAIMGMPGCESAPSTATLDSGIQNYEAKRYDLAEEQALDVMKHSQGAERDEAAYLAGLSSYQLGQADEARDTLSVAARSKDDETAGRALAQLGVIELDRNHPRDAAAHFQTAAGKLEGQEAEQASQHAAMAYQLAGDYNSAKQWNQRAGSNNSTSQTVGRTTSSSTSTHSRFVLQAGAFKSRKLAEKAARDIEPLASQHRLGPVQIVQNSGGHSAMLYLVQFGGFATRTEAARIRATLGKLEFIVVPAG